MSLRLALVALLLGACAGAQAPTPTPGHMDDVIANLVLRGVTVHRLVSGDSGCPSQDLHDNAVHMEVAVGAQSALKDIYLFRWRRQADFDAASNAFNACAEVFAASRPGVDVARIEAPPWRAYGPWDEQLREVVSGALEATGAADPLQD